MNDFTMEGNLVDIHQGKIYPARIVVQGNHIITIEKLGDAANKQWNYILPGFIDSHVHIESSMLIPSEFARLAVVHGTVATVSDPHEIANVCGLEGVSYMIENGKTVPFKFNFGAPSCVPATVFETAGATLGVKEVTALLQNNDIKYLSEMMNFPGVLHEDEAVLQKIKAAHVAGKPVDGHAPGLRGKDAKKYIETLSQSQSQSLPQPYFPSTDHECFTADEALDKLKFGMKILIREGSAARNFEALIGLLESHPNEMMFCSDDKHPDSLEAGHINKLCARAVAKGIDVFKILKAACVNPVLHYKLDVGLLRADDFADFIVVKDLVNFEVVQTYIDGLLVAENGTTKIDSKPATIINQFNCSLKKVSDFLIPALGETAIPAMEAMDGQLITNKVVIKPKIVNGFFESDTETDVLKIVVINRYKNVPVAIAFIKNFGLKQGAIASSVAHDSHNVIAVGVNDKSICDAVNLIIEASGGIAAVNDTGKKMIALPVAGLMSTENGYKIAAEYTAIDKMAKEMGSVLSAPFMTLSFMALLVIPELKLSDKGLFDGRKFSFVSS